MRYFIIAGEASGDLHGATLIHAIKQIDGSATFQAWGGEKMEKEGATILKNIKELAFMGFAQVARNIFTIFKNFALVKEQIQKFKPHAVILIDYPGFNLRMAKWLHENNFKVIYYIAPQVWAWKENRVDIIKKFINLLICILPFEKDFFDKRNIDAHYVGHPLLEQINCKFDRKKIIALLPGSRKQEIESMLPEMLKVIDDFPDYTFEILKAPNIEEAFYYQFTDDKILLAKEGAEKLMNRAEAALVTSGTATLETALYKVPQLVCYKTSAWTYAIAKKLIKVKYISLVNLIMDKEVVPELIQQDLNKEKLKNKLSEILEQGLKREDMLQAYEALEQKLKQENTASQKAAELIISYLENKR